MANEIENQRRRIYEEERDASTACQKFYTAGPLPLGSTPPAMPPEFWAGMNEARERLMRASEARKAFDIEHPIGPPTSDS